MINLFKKGTRAMRLETGQPEALKKENRRLIVSLIENESSVSRADLARISGLSRTSVTKIIKELIEVKAVTEEGDLASTGGRPGTRLALDTRHWLALGAELRGGEWTFVALDLQANIVHTLELPTASDDPVACIKRLCEGVRQLQAAFPGKLLPAIGLGVPGITDGASGTIKHAGDLGWAEVPVVELVKAEMGLPAFIMNRHRLAGLAEMRASAAAARDLIYIGIGTGIIATLFHKGEMLEGASFSSGELGHVTVLTDGPLCSCGGRGCLRTLASGPAIVHETRERLGRGEPSILRLIGQAPEALTVEAIFEAARQGDDTALACLRKAGRYLGIALSNLVHLLNPDSIVIGGPVGQCGEPLIGIVREEVEARTLSHPLAALTICGGKLGRNAGAIGAARLVLDKKLQLLFGFE